MNNFTDAMVRWQPFYAAVAGVSATLVGLLFVSLSLNRERITTRENRVLFRLARRSFGDFLYALFIALMFLMPHYRATHLAIILIGLSIFRFVFLVYAILNYAKPEGHNLSKFAAMRDYSFQALTSLGLLISAIEIYYGEMIALYYLVPIVAFLLYNASHNAWTLLMLEQNAAEKTPRAPYGDCQK